MKGVMNIRSGSGTEEKCTFFTFLAVDHATQGMVWMGWVLCTVYCVS